jgi:hypothetical protein
MLPSFAHAVPHIHSNPVESNLFISSLVARFHRCLVSLSPMLLLLVFALSVLLVGVLASTTSPMRNSSGS